MTFGITILTLIMLALKYQGQIQNFSSVGGGGGGGGVQIPCPFPLYPPMRPNKKDLCQGNPALHVPKFTGKFYMFSGEKKI